MQAMALPLRRSSRYELPLTWRIWPEEICFASSSTAFWYWSAVNGPEMSVPCSSMISPIVSRISDSTTILPLRSGAHRSSMVLSSRPTLSLR